MEKYLSKNMHKSIDFNQTIKLPRHQLRNLELENFINAEREVHQGLMNFTYEFKD